MEFSKELIDAFKKSQFFNTEASLYNMNTGRTIDTEPDEEGYVYIPEMTNLYPTSLVKNGDDEDAEYDYVFIMKLINEFRDQALKN